MGCTASATASSEGKLEPAPKCWETVKTAWEKESGKIGWDRSLTKALFRELCYSTPHPFQKNISKPERSASLNTNKNHNHPTCPEVESVKSVRVEVISSTIGPPVLSAARVGDEAGGVGPSHSQHRGEVGCCLVLDHHDLKVPLLVHGWAFLQANVQVRSHAGDGTTPKYPVRNYLSCQSMVQVCTPQFNICIEMLSLWLLVGSSH